MHAPNAITLRSIIIALLLMPFNSIYLVASEILWLTTAPTALSLFYNVIFILFLLVLLNGILKRLRPQWVLQPGELFTIYTMLSFSSAICSIDMMDILIPTMAFLDHFHPLEGQYADIVPYVPEWLRVKDPVATSAYFLGQESIFDPAVFIPWLKPLAIWFCFTLALLAVMGGLVLLFRKPWTQYEKLSYPVLQVPMTLVKESSTLLRNKVFWAGFLLVASVDMMNGLHYYYPLIPRIPLVRIVNIQAFFSERPWTDMGATWVSFYPFAVALCFFMPVDLAFSSWFFFFVFKFQSVFASHIGISGMPGFPYIEEQTVGGYYALALLALWITRRHLWRMLRLAVGLEVESEEMGDRGEARLAAWLILGGGGFLLAFSLYNGMHTLIAIAFFLSYFAIGVAITRMRAELGYPSHDLHAIGPNIQIIQYMGTPEMTRYYKPDLAMFAFYHYITRAYRSHPMPHALEALRIAEREKMNERRYLLAMAIACVFGILFAYFGGLWVFTKYGASNISNIGEWMGREIWVKTQSYFTAPDPYTPAASGAIIIGLLFSLSLAVIRMNTAWWPFHPVGYAVSGSWSMDQLWSSFILAWLIKLLILRYGGAKAHKAVLPLFIGVIIGDFFVGTGWSLYGVIAEVDVYRFWPY